MSFTLEVPYLVWSAPGGVTICQQDGLYYLVRLDPIVDVGPIPFTAMGPYATADEAGAAVGDFPPPVEVVPVAPLMPPPPEETPPA